MSHTQDSPSQEPDPAVLALSTLFDNALAKQDEYLFQCAFKKLEDWALRLVQNHFSNKTLAREFVQDALLAVHRKNRRCLLSGTDYTRIVYTHLLGSKEVGIPGSIRKHKRRTRTRRARMLSLDDPVVPGENLLFKDIIPDTTPDPVEVLTVVNIKKKEVHLLLTGLKKEISVLRQKSKVNIGQVETLRAFYDYVFAKVDGLQGNELADLQICIVTVTKSQKILDRELSEYLQQALHLDQNTVRKRVDRHILKSPTVLGLFGGNIKK